MFLKNLFKRKAGGTRVGNWLQSIAHTYSFGIFGNGNRLRENNNTENGINYI